MRRWNLGGKVWFVQLGRKGGSQNPQIIEHQPILRWGRWKILILEIPKSRLFLLESPPSNHLLPITLGSCELFGVWEFQAQFKCSRSHPVGFPIPGSIALSPPFPTLTILSFPCPGVSWLLPSPTLPIPHGYRNRQSLPAILPHP